MTAARCFVLTPTDTLFFRDGRPYNQDDEGLAHARSLFPPHPSTLTGALRAALALGQGWDGRSGWNAEHREVLGDGPDLDGGSLRFGAPVLLRRLKGDNWEPLYPAPRALVRADGCFNLLRPGRRLDCDLGKGVRLPVDPSGTRRKPAKNVWLTPAGLALVLNDRAHELDAAHVRDSADLWKPEPRVGLELEKTSRTAKQGRLYAPIHVRLAGGVALGQSVEGLPEDWAPARVVPLGGEHRTAVVDVMPPPSPPPRAAAFRPTPDGTRQCVMLTLLSSARVGKDWLRPGRVPGWSVDIVSACLGDPVPIGGWDSRAASKGPRALRAFLPAGSTWFLHTPSGWADGALPPFLGDEWDARHGFGRFALGTFTDTDDGADLQGDHAQGDHE